MLLFRLDGRKWMAALASSLLITTSLVAQAHRLLTTDACTASVQDVFLFQESADLNGQPLTRAQKAMIKLDFYENCGGSLRIDKDLMLQHMGSLQKLFQTFR